MTTKRIRSTFDALVALGGGLCASAAFAQVGQVQQQ